MYSAKVVASASLSSTSIASGSLLVNPYGRSQAGYDDPVAIQLTLVVAGRICVLPLNEL
jgi:hypothetical protein